MKPTNIVFIMAAYIPSRKYSLRVVEKRLEYFTNSRFRCSNKALALGLFTCTDTAATASSTFFIVLAISLKDANN